MVGSIERAVRIVRGLRVLNATPPDSTPQDLIPQSPAEPGYWSARGLLQSAGVAMPAARRVRDPDHLSDAAAVLDPPWVLKADWIEHKTEHNAVVLGLTNEAELLSSPGEHPAPSPTRLNGPTTARSILSAVAIFTTQPTAGRTTHRAVALLSRCPVDNQCPRDAPERSLPPRKIRLLSTAIHSQARRTQAHRSDGRHSSWAERTRSPCSHHWSASPSSSRAVLHDQRQGLLPGGSPGNCPAGPAPIKTWPMDQVRS